MTSDPAMTPQQRKLTQGGLQTYKNLVVGEDATWMSLVVFELYQLCFISLPGLIGIASRSFASRFIFGKVGRRVALGRNISIKSPSKIFFDNGVLVDDGAALEVRGNKGKIDIFDRVVIGKGSIISAKDAHIILHAGVNIGTNCRVASQSKIEIGESTLIAAYAYVGPGNHQKGDATAPLIEQPMSIKGGVKIGKNCWIGTRATILDGVIIGDGAIIGAHSLVKDDVPEGATVAGVPARVINS